MPPERLTGLADLAQRYAAHLKRRGFAVRSVEAYQSGLDRFLEYLDESHIRRASEITRETIGSYQAALYTGHSARGRPLALRTQALHLLIVRSFCRFLVREGVVLLNPADELEMPRPPPRHAPRNVPTEAELRKLIKAPDTREHAGVRDRAMLEVLYSTGMRVGELIALKVYDVDLVNGLVQVIAGKGGKDRVVPLGRMAVRALQLYLEKTRPYYLGDNTLNVLFVTHHGERLFRSNVARQIRKYCVKAKIERHITPHSLRHACATHMLRRRASIRHIQELLGHKQLSTTQLYTHVQVDDLKAVHARTHPRENPGTPRGPGRSTSRRARR